MSRFYLMINGLSICRTCFGCGLLSNYNFKGEVDGSPIQKCKNYKECRSHEDVLKKDDYKYGSQYGNNN
jgi:hypothetical protein